MIKIVKISVLLLLLTGCNTTKEEISTSLLGVVYDYKSNPVKSASVNLKNSDHEYRVSTDIDGKFMVPDMEFGDYKVEVLSKGYKVTTTEMSHLDSQNVLIIRIFSYDDLLLRFNNQIRTKEYNFAGRTMVEIEKIDKKDIYYNYLKSIYLIETGEYKEAETLLLDLEERTMGEAYIYLLLADLYQYNLNNSKKAVFYLKRFLNREYTINETNRLKELESVKKDIKG